MEDSMKTRFGVASINALAGDWSEQMVAIRQAIAAARKAACALVVFPELAIGGPDLQDVWLRPDTSVYAEQVLTEIITETAGLTVVCGLPMAHDGRLYNVAAVIHDCRLMAIVPKRYLTPNDAELRWFSAWDFSKGSKFHHGAVMGAWNSTIAGLEGLDICVGTLQSHPTPARGAIVIEMNNRRFAPNLYREELSLRLEYSKKLGITLIRSNILGSDDGTHIYDGGGFIVTRGNMKALCPRFVFDRPFVLTTSDDEIPNGFDPSLAHFAKVGSSPKQADDYAFAEIELALALGLNDYMKRAHIEKLCLALSGGRDSAMIAVLVARMVALKHAQLDEAEQKAIVGQTLVTAYLPSRHSSSSGTQKAALALAQELGFSCPVIEIADIASHAVSTIESVANRQLSWESDDLTLQNVQARARSLVIWTLANANNAMLLTTGNMSEAAVGYATMDGDSSGCLDPIGNIPKTLVSRWLEWARQFHKIDALDFVFAQPPSAELRPAHQNQADETDLMPYPVLDALIEWFLVRRMTPKEILQCAKNQLANYYTNADDIEKDVKRFILLTVRSQWKRARFANEFIILPFNIAPDDGLRWPCLQAPFRRAIDEMA